MKQKKKKLKTRSSSMLLKIVLKIVDMNAIANEHFVIVIANLLEFSLKTLQKSYLQLLSISKMMMLEEAIFWSFKSLTLNKRKKELQGM